MRTFLIRIIYNGFEGVFFQTKSQTYEGASAGLLFFKVCQGTGMEKELAPNIL
jgi:hypothetical protein